MGEKHRKRIALIPLKSRAKCASKFPRLPIAGDATQPSLRVKRLARFFTSRLSWAGTVPAPPLFPMPTAATPTTPAAYLAALDQPRRAELKALHAAIRKAVPQLKPHLAYSGTMIGYGPYHYKYASGREGDCPIVAISSRAQYISLYVLGCRDGRTIAEAAKARLGKVSVGKACIRFKKLADLNLPVALELVRESSSLLTNGSTDFAL
jgi:hypothetical protein